MWLKVALCAKRGCMCVNSKLLGLKVVLCD